MGNPTIFTSIGDLTLQQVETQSSGTTTEVSSAATLNAYSGVVTSQSLTTAAGAVHTMTLTDSAIVAGSLVLASVGNGTNTGGTPAMGPVTPGAGSATFTIQNIHATAAFNGTLVISFKVITP